MKLIDAEALKTEILKAPVWTGLDAIAKINTMPSIDITRCKECKHGTYYEEAEMYICNANDQDLYEAEHFCSYGERSE